MIWPEDLSPIVFVAGEYGPPAQFPISLWRVCEVRSIEAHQFNGRKSNARESRHVTRVMNHNCVNWAPFSVEFAHPVPKRKVPRGEVKLEEVIKGPLCSSPHGRRLIQEVSKKGLHLGDHKEVPIRLRIQARPPPLGARDLF